MKGRVRGTCIVVSGSEVPERDSTREEYGANTEDNEEDVVSDVS